MGAAFILTILICSASLDHAACQPSTASDVIRAPYTMSEMECARRGQMQLGTSGLAPRPGLDYAKMICERVPQSRNR